MLDYKKRLKPLSRDLRNKSTKEEIILWSKIRKKQILDTQFYRQKPINGYIVDFYAPKANLVIELDGAHHFETVHSMYDQLRSDALSSQGITVKRYSNNQINRDLSKVLDDIYNYMSSYYTLI